MSDGESKNNRRETSGFLSEGASPWGSRKIEGEGSAQDVLLGLVTTPPGDAERVAGTLVDRGLAACCNIISPVTSVFHWEGARETEPEALLVLKTTRARSKDLIDTVREIHPYDIPEVIFLPVVSGLEDYLKWVHDECRPREKSE